MCGRVEEVESTPERASSREESPSRALERAALSFTSAFHCLDLAAMDIDQERPRLSQSVSQDEQAPLITIIHSVKGELAPSACCALLSLMKLYSRTTVNAVHRLWSNSLSEVRFILLCYLSLAVSLLKHLPFAIRKRTWSVSAKPCTSMDTSTTSALPSKGPSARRRKLGTDFVEAALADLPSAALCSGQIIGNDLLEDVVSMAVTEVLDRKNIVRPSLRRQGPSRHSRR